MADAIFSSFQHTDIQSALCHLRGYGVVNEAVVDQDKQFSWFQMDQERGEAQSLHNQETIPSAWAQNDSRNREVPDGLRQEADVKPKPSEVRKHVKEIQGHSFSLASLELLNSYGKALKNAIDESVSVSPRNENVHGRKLSLGEIVRVAGERYIQFSTQKIDGLSMFIHPYSSSLSNLSIEETADIELVQLLLAGAECVGHRQFDDAEALIARCRFMASDTGNAAQRIVFHFAEALRQRIDIETGRTTMERIQEKATYQMKLQVDFNISFLVCHQELPFSQAIQFAAVQAIVENVKTARKIHLIDLHIRSGIQWTVLMQAIAEREDRPYLKISALETSDKQHLENTGKRLENFAQSMNIPFSFKTVSPLEIKELRDEMLGKEPDEAVAVYSPIILRTMISTPDKLGSLMRSIRKLRPSIMVVIEVEANHNSPSFVNRFTESLFFYSAFFDCLEDCMGRDNQHRRTIEGIYLGEGIGNIIGTEGDKRCTRNVKLDVWREFFSRYGMAEMELSESSLYQANMVLNKFPRSSSCTLKNDGKGVVIEWKGTPIHSLTTWKFL